MKPLGCSAMLQVSRPSRAEDAVWDAIEAAIAVGWTPERFKQEVVEAWQHLLREESKRVAEVLR